MIPSVVVCHRAPHHCIELSTDCSRILRCCVQSGSTAISLHNVTRGYYGVTAFLATGPSSAPVISQEQKESHPYLAKALETPWLVASARTLVETYVGGRALYNLWLDKVARGIIAKFAEPDKRYVRAGNHSIDLNPELASFICS